MAKGSTLKDNSLITGVVKNITGLPGYEKNCIAQFLGVKDALHFAASCKNVYQTLSLSYVPPGIIFENPIHWTGSYYTGDAPLMYHERLPLLFSRYTNLRSVVVSLQWRGFKGQIYVVATLTNQTASQNSGPNPLQNGFGGGRLVYESPLAEHSYKPLCFSFRPRPDETYYLWYKVGGEGHELILRNVRLQTSTRPATILHENCMFGDVRKVEWMLQQGGANPNATDSDGWTPLHEALTQNPLHDAVLKLLLRHGANPNAAAKDGWTPLHEACKNGNAPIVALLLGKKAYPNVTKLDGWTPLHEACSNGHDSVVELLLNHKANPNATDYDGRSPLHVACKHAHTSIIKTLLNYGANSNATNKIGSTPLHEACKSGNEEIAALLLKHEAQPTCQTIQWWTPLHEASKNGSRAVVALLLEHEADINAVNKDGLTARHLALLNKKNSVVDLFSANRDNSGRAVRLPESQSANIGRWRCRNPLIECVAGLEKRTAKTLRKILPKKVTALDKLLREMREDAGDIFCVYTGTLDAMTDDLVVKARSSGISLDEVTHAMFACKESRTWLHNLLLERLLMSETLVTEVVSLLCFGKNMDHCLFTDAVLYFNDESFRVIGSNREHESLNLSEYTEVPSLHVEQVRMKAHKHRNGVYQLVGERIVCALVPHEEGVKYFLRNDCADFVKETKLVDQLGTGPCRAQDTVEELVAWGCDKVLAWKLLTCSQLPNHPPLDDICDQLVQSFKFISNFRMQLRVAINDSLQLGATSLLGSEIELRQSRQDADEHFAPDRRVYQTAQRNCILGIYEPLEPFSGEFLEQDVLKTHMKLLSKLIERAKRSDVNTGKTKHKQSYFDARTVAFLGALNGGRVSSSFVSKYARTQYCYQDDDDTKSLCTPSSNQILFATTKDLRILEQVQHLENDANSFKNWVALRAAFEFDVESEEFLYDTPYYKRANQLVERNITVFMKDVSSRFTEVFAMAPMTVSVSHLRKLCDKIAELTGASSAWLVREMISMYVASGAGISGPEQNTGYGRMEHAMKQLYHNPQYSTKVLHFDEKVNLEGVIYRENKNGRSCLREFPGKKGSQVVLFEGHIDVVESFCDVFPSSADRVVETVWV